MHYITLCIFIICNISYLFMLYIFIMLSISAASCSLLNHCESITIVGLFVPLCQQSSRFLSLLIETNKARRVTYLHTHTHTHTHIHTYTYIYIYIGYIYTYTCTHILFRNIDRHVREDAIYGVVIVADREWRNTFIISCRKTERRNNANNVNNAALYTEHTYCNNTSFSISAPYRQNEIIIAYD